MPAVSLTGPDNSLTCVLFLSSHNAVGQSYLVRYVLFRDCSTYIVLCYKINMPQASSWIE